MGRVRSEAKEPRRDSSPDLAADEAAGLEVSVGAFGGMAGTVRSHSVVCVACPESVEALAA